MKIAFIAALLIVQTQALHYCTSSRSCDIRGLITGINNTPRCAGRWSQKCNLFGRNCDYCSGPLGDKYDEVNNWCKGKGGQLCYSECYHGGCTNWCDKNIQK
ncbi:hypothetical protein BGW38_008395, partial [Lunasporangiospora selenospora]